MTNHYNCIKKKIKQYVAILNRCFTCSKRETRKRNCSTIIIYTINIYICLYYICCTYLHLIGIFHTLPCNSFLLDFCASFPRKQTQLFNNNALLPHFSPWCIHGTRLPSPLHFQFPNVYQADENQNSCNSNVSLFIVDFCYGTRAFSLWNGGWFISTHQVLGRDRGKCC